VAEPPQQGFGRALALRQLLFLPFLVFFYLLTGLVAFYPALQSYFSSDDFFHLAQVVEGGWPFSSRPGSGGFVRPFIALSFWVEHRLWGLQPFGYHLSNVVVHIANSLLVAAFAFGIQPKAVSRRFLTSTVAGLIFLLLACHAEPVSWISGRTDVFATFWVLLSLCLARYGLERASGAGLLSSLATLIVALSTKESAIALPFLLYLVAAYLLFEGRARRSSRTWAWLFGIVVVFLGYMIVRRLLLGTFVGGYGARGHLRMSRDILAQATGRYSWRAFFPPVSEGVASWFATHATLLAWLWLAALVLAFSGLMYRAWRRKRPGMALFYFCSFWTALLPVINIRIQWTNSESERFLYLATVFAAMALAHLLSRIPWSAPRIGLIVLTLTLQSLWLEHGVERWKEASFIARSIVQGVQESHAHGRIVLVNKPDSMDGAIILRTGLGEALAYFGDAPTEDATVDVVYAATLFHEDHGFAMEKTGADTYRIQATDPRSVIGEEDRGDIVETLSTDSRQCTFRFRIPLQDASIFYYDRGGVKKFTR